MVKNVAELYEHVAYVICVHLDELDGIEGDEAEECLEEVKQRRASYLQMLSIHDHHMNRRT